MKALNVEKYAAELTRIHKPRMRISELAGFLNVCCSTVLRWEKSKRIPGRGIDRRFSLYQVIIFLEKEKLVPDNDPEQKALKRARASRSKRRVFTENW